MSSIRTSLHRLKEHLKWPFVFFFLLVLLLTGGYLLAHKNLLEKEMQKKLNYSPFQEKPYSQTNDSPSLSPGPSITPLPTTSQTIAVTRIPTEEWGKSQQIGEYTWTIKVGQDERQTTDEELFEALNAYRKRFGRSELIWDEKLAAFAQDRVKEFEKLRKTDAHKGFKEYIEKEDGFNSLGFHALGENSSFGYKLHGIHYIEWVYAGDKPHDDNQLSDKWSHVGVGVEGLSTNLIFGGKKS